MNDRMVEALYIYMYTFQMRACVQLQLLRENTPQISKPRHIHTAEFAFPIPRPTSAAEKRMCSF